MQCILSSPICCFSARKLVQKKKEKRYQNYDLSRALTKLFTLTCPYQLEDCGVRVPRKFRRRHDLPLNAQVKNQSAIWVGCNGNGGIMQCWNKQWSFLPMSFPCIHYRAGVIICPILWYNGTLFWSRKIDSSAYVIKWDGRSCIGVCLCAQALHVCGDAVWSVLPDSTLDKTGLTLLHLRIFKSEILYQPKVPPVCAAVNFLTIRRIVKRSSQWDSYRSLIWVNGPV